MQKILLDYLAKAEGTIVHRNATETDITAPYGIYKTQHPEAQIFKAIDEDANKIGLNSDSTTWVQDDLDKLNESLDSSKMEQLAGIFYDTFLKDAHMILYPLECVITRFSLYVNSPKLANEVTQEAINLFIQNKFIKHNILVVDGAIGLNTNNALREVYNLSLRDNAWGYLFESYMLLMMSKNYAKLAASNQQKYLRYLNGWNNRLYTLASA